MTYLHCNPRIVQRSAQGGVLLQTTEDKVMTAMFLYGGAVPVRMKPKSTHIHETVAIKETYKGTILAKMKVEINGDYTCFVLLFYGEGE